MVQEPESEVYKKALEMTQKVCSMPKLRICTPTVSSTVIETRSTIVQAPALHAELQKQLQSSQVAQP